MMENQSVGDNHNAPVFLWCYRRMGQLIPELIGEGCEPRVMLDYSGTLLHGLQQMGLPDVFDDLKRITCEPAYRRAVEWLGTAWGHAVAPSTPVQDFRLHVSAWQHHFAALFGQEALRRVHGFSPAELALPNHPDVAYAFVRTLRDCGYEWVLVQEHTVEPLEGGALVRRHLPHRSICRNSRGAEASISPISTRWGSRRPSCRRFGASVRSGSGTGSRMPRDRNSSNGSSKSCGTKITDFTSTAGAGRTTFRGSEGTMPCSARWIE